MPVKRFTLDSDEDIDGGMHYWLAEDPNGEYMLYDEHQADKYKLSVEVATWRSKFSRPDICEKAITTLQQSLDIQRSENRSALKLLEEYLLHGDSCKFYDRVKDFMRDYGVTVE